MINSAVEAAAGTGNDDVLKTALARFQVAGDANTEWRQNATEDLKMCANDQWDAGARRAREVTGRPCMTEDHISPAVRQIVNESRQNRPAIEVDAKGDGADLETAKIYGGLIRDIEYQSNADTAYDIAEEYAVKTGLGYFRLVSEFDDPSNFDQVLRVKQVEDPLTVFIDPDHREVDGADMEWGFIVKDIVKEAFKRSYPKAKLSTMDSWGTYTTATQGWVRENMVRLAEYFYKEHDDVTLYHVAHFTPNAEGKLQFFMEEVVEEKPDADKLESKETVILNQRTAQKVTVKWCILNGHEVLDEKVFPGEFIPIFPVKGEEFWVEGKRITMGAVRRAKDTQVVINYMVSNQVEAIDLSNKVPYVGAAGQFDTFETNWRTANQRNYSYLEYNPVDINGKPAPPPSRQSVETPIQAISATRQQSDDAMKGIFGIYESATGAQSNETSGVAILARKEQSSNSNFHYYDNLVRAIKHLGRVLVAVIPTYYDTARTIRIIKPNGDQELVAINQTLEDGRKHDMAAGKYAVTIKTGPSYNTRRQKLVETGTQLIAAYPNAGPLIADLVVAAGDGEGNQEMAARLRTQVPPEVLAATGEDDTGGDPKAKLAAAQMQLMTAKKNLEALNSHAQQVEQELKFTAEENKLLKEKASLELMKAEGDYNIKSRQMELDEQTTELEFLIKQEELELQREQLEIEKSKLAISGIKVAADMNDKDHTKQIELLDRAALKKSEGYPSLTVGGTNPDIGTVGGLDNVDLGGKIGVDTL